MFDQRPDLEGFLGATCVFGYCISMYLLHFGYVSHVVGSFFVGLFVAHSDEAWTDWPVIMGDVRYVL